MSGFAVTTEKATFSELQKALDDAGNNKKQYEKAYEALSRFSVKQHIFDPITRSFNDIIYHQDGLIKKYSNSPTDYSQVWSHTGYYILGKFLTETFESKSVKPSVIHSKYIIAKFNGDLIGISSASIFVRKLIEEQPELSGRLKIAEVVKKLHPINTTYEVLGSIPICVYDTIGDTMGDISIRSIESIRHDLFSETGKIRDTKLAAYDKAAYNFYQEQLSPALKEFNKKFNDPEEKAFIKLKANKKAEEKGEKRRKQEELNRARAQKSATRKLSSRENSPSRAKSSSQEKAPSRGGKQTSERRYINRQTKRQKYKHTI